MATKNINVNNKKVRKSNFYKNKNICNIDDIDTNNILVSKKESYINKNSHKYFIGYNDNDIISPICTKLPHITGYVREVDENAAMSFVLKDKELLKNYIRIWEKIEKLIKINSESMPIYSDDDKYLKTKIKIYAGAVTTNIYKTV